MSTTKQVTRVQGTPDYRTDQLDAEDALHTTREELVILRKKFRAMETELENLECREDGQQQLVMHAKDLRRMAAAGEDMGEYVTLAMYRTDYYGL